MPLDERRSRQILEVAEDASLEEVSAAYQLLKRIHGSDQGIFGGAGMEEFSLEARQEALAAIEAAYALLRARFIGVTAGDEAPAAGPEPAPVPGAEPDPPAPGPVPAPEPARGFDPPPVPAAEPGPAATAPAPPAGPCEPAEEAEPAPAQRTALWQARRAFACTLDDVAGETHVPRAFLQAIEEERFGDLPLAPVHVRGYLTAFLHAIHVDPEAFLPGYMQRFQDWRGRR